ncbi:MAG: transglutaminase family protein, partial [Verrucomicrobiales bacterium]|nr:transglutaminase family protein [Verrucomicrobiales bacterium]
DASALQPLGLAPPESDLEQGQRIAAMGNPQGLDYSIVEGVVSAVRTFELSALYGPMIQLTIPIEPGNSGGPLIDLKGRVHGILSVKSLITENLGFATPAAALRPLLEKPNPVPYDRWLTIGAIDPARWTPLMGADWHQRAGRIHVTTPGTGFGGRSLLLTNTPPEKAAYEIAVSVKLDDESGAAGLVFASDGADTHYGFYPTGGSLRFTRFEGPSVFSWTILEQFESTAYKPGDWNDLRVRVTPESITGWVNGSKILESTDSKLRGGKIGLAKFRETVAEFRNFRTGKNLATKRPSQAQLKSIRTAVRSLPRNAQPDAQTAELLSADPHLADTIISDRAENLEAQARALRGLASELHTSHIARRLAEITATGQTDLAEAALLIAQLDDTDLEPAPYLGELDRLAADLKSRISEKPDADPLALLNTLLFSDNGYHGSRHDYYNSANSFLNQVIDDREGIPISLSVLYLEIARRAGIPDLVGLGLPGHFIVAEQAGDDEPYTRYIDVFEAGT